MGSHQSGKGYKRKLEELQKASIPEQRKIVTDSEEEDKRIAKLESLAAKWRDFISDTISETIEHIQKKQSQTAEEMEADDTDGEDDDSGVDCGSDLGDDDDEE